MKANVSVKGYTSVIMVLNMKRFVRGESQNEFETVRCTQEFADFLRENWRRAAENQDLFLPRLEYKKVQGSGEILPEDVMTPEQLGYATGIFRRFVLEKFSYPTYKLDKTKVHFPEELRDNFQFKTLFQRVWDDWDVYLRPSHTGFFIIRLTRLYRQRPREITRLAQDVLNLQESLDVASAKNWLLHNRERFANQPDLLAKKERSIQALLEWVGATDQKGPLLYFPVNWKLAMEVGGLFVREIAQKIVIPGRNTINLDVPAPDISLPLHDSYVIYHIENMFADPAIVKRAEASQSKNARVEVGPTDIHHSVHIRKALVNLAEGSMLTCENGADCQFPTPRWSITDSLMENNQASWNDEFCHLTSRTAIMFPSGDWKDHELAVSTFPGSTLQVKYPRYWGALERLLEFVVEIGVLSLLIEGVTYDLLEEIVHTVQVTRDQMFEGDIQLGDGMPDLVSRAAQLRRQASLAQSLSHAQLWSRAEYAILKADYLFEQLGVPQTLQHIRSNISSINSVVDHIDELYLADLSEQNNDKATIMSLGLAAASLILTVLSLPSFFVDLRGLGLIEWVHWFLGVIGALLAFFLMGSAVYLLWVTIRRRQRMVAFLERISKKEAGPGEGSIPPKPNE